MIQVGLEEFRAFCQYVFTVVFNTTNTFLLRNGTTLIFQLNFSAG